VTATKKHIPGKRLKTWHRSISLPRPSLRAFVRDLIANGTLQQKMTALKWAGGKVSP
jgi:hypothetical protein